MDSNEMKKTIFLKNIENDEIYTILLTEEEAKCLGADKSISEINHAESLHSDHSDNIGVFKWPHKAILLLIEEYNLRQEDFINGKMSHKKIWSLIADKIKKHGYNVTGPQCLSKFTGLKRTYNGIKESNRKPRSIVWPYFSKSSITDDQYRLQLIHLSCALREKRLEYEGCSKSPVHFFHRKNWIASKDKSFFRYGIRKLPERWEKVVGSDRQYFN
ncbi:hypothetical protein ALC53_14072 [Atta colombica]|uniref:Myb/SANT-like DNA-binding domain-containing protein n=1 Tax=Atta colombica TaxID=520822 RepID=A0A195AT55_9HYME|nr:hypothetical protein ALC53_14072 [Atta colombica]